VPKVTNIHKAAVRERIIQAAIESFGQTGFDRTKMDDIARRLGLSKGTLYLYFKSKEDLFLAICEHNMGDKGEDATLFMNRENIVSDAEQLYDNIRRRERGMDKVILEMVVESSRNPRLRKVVHQYQSMIHDHVAQELKKKLDEGFISKDIDVTGLAVAIVALFDGLSVNRMLGISEPVNKKAWVAMVRAIINAGAGGKRY
jgi:AcrR family transcriptional regulator